jgi:threonine dehydrogenase-like Zn-dependent dehydrogenase
MESNQTTIPETHRALILSSLSSPPTVEELPTPQAGPGSAVIRMLASNVLSYSREVYNGSRNYPFPLPLVIGASGIGRVAEVGPDSTLLKPGQLVLIDPFVHSRDDPNAAFLLGLHEGYSEGSKKLMRGEWKNATYAEYAKLPIENCHPLDETKLLSEGLGYTVEELTLISGLLVPFGGLNDIGLKPGETVIVAPATGPFGRAAVKVALAMGARVIAMGRNIDMLKLIKGKNERVKIVQITGEMEADNKALLQYGPVDAYFDISPPEAATSTHLKSAILALRHSGRVSLMGGIRGDIAIPLPIIVHRDLQLKGKWMYSREDVRQLTRLVEVGQLRLGDGNGQEMIKKFALEDWHNAFEAAALSSGTETKAVIIP